MSQLTRLQCTCGQVQLDVERAPIISAECHCNSCRAAGGRLSGLANVAPFLEANGGTRFVLYRKDRIHFRQGMALLKEFRLTPTSTTRRVVASCCHTPVFLEFENGHWLSLYACMWPRASLPALDLRTMTSDLPDTSVLSADVPSGKWPTTAFYAKLLGAWVAMGFKSPKIAVNGELTV